MKWKLLFLVTSFSTLLTFQLQAQQADKVIFRNEILRADQEGGMLKITFRLDVSEDEFFDIRELEIHTDGRVIHSKALSGDVQDITAGEHVIYWDVFKDVDQLESISDMKIKLQYTDLTQNRMKMRSVEDELLRRREEIRRDADAARERESRKQKETVIEDEQITEPEDTKPKKKKGWNRAYRHFRVGLKSGVNIMTPEVRSQGHSHQDFDLDYTPGWTIGAVTRLHFTKFWGLSAEVHYGISHMNFKYDVRSMEQYSGYSEELRVEHDKQMKFRYTKYPVYVTTHLNENLTFLFGKYWTNYSKVKISGEFNREWKTYDDSGDFRSEGDYQKEIDISLLDNLLDKGNGLPFNEKDNGWILGMEVDSKKASFGVYYEWSANNAFNEDYFDVNYSIWHQNINMKTDVLPEVENTRVYMQQLSLQLTIWL